MTSPFSFAIITNCVDLPMTGLLRASAPRYGAGKKIEGKEENNANL